MKLFIVIMTTFLMQVSASSSAQLITLKQSNLSLRQAFDHIRKQTGYMQGVKVSVKGTEDFATTNENGAYSIKAKEGDTLEFSIKGFSTYSIDVEKNIVLNIKLQPE